MKASFVLPHVYTWNFHIEGRVLQRLPAKLESGLWSRASRETGFGLLRTRVLSRINFSGLAWWHKYSRGRRLWEFKATLVYRVSSNPARAIQRPSLRKTKIKNKLTFSFPNTGIPLKVRHWANASVPHFYNCFQPGSTVARCFKLGDLGWVWKWHWWP